MFQALVPAFQTNHLASGGKSLIQQTLGAHIWLVFSTILKNMKVNGKDYPIYYGKIKNVPNHQPDIVSTVFSDAIACLHGFKISKG